MWPLILLGPVIFLIFGVDQLRNTEHWFEYIPPWMKRLLPGGPDRFMKLHAVLNILLAIWILSGVALKLAAGLSVIWMASIVVVTFLSGKWRIAVRDSSITLGLIGLYLLI